MTTDDREFDTLVREALSAEERAVFDRLGEPSLPELLGEAYRGRRRWLNLYATGLTLAFLALTIVSTVRILRADEVAEMLRWGLGFAFGLGMVMILKLWFWLEMQRYALAREVKRVELAVAHLAARLNARGGPDA